MAQNQGGEGKGKSKEALSSEKQDALRKAKKTTRRKGGKGRLATGTTLFEGIQQDRKEQREERETERLEAIDRAYTRALEHLTRFGEKQVPGYASMRPRWSTSTLANAKDLLQMYFYTATIDEITALEERVGERIYGEVRRRFASACHFEWNARGTTAHGLPWFKDALAAAKQFHEELRANRRGPKRTPATTNPTQTADAETDRVLVEA